MTTFWSWVGDNFWILYAGWALGLVSGRFLYVIVEWWYIGRDPALRS